MPHFFPRKTSPALLWPYWVYETLKPAEPLEPAISFGGGQCTAIAMCVWVYIIHPRRPRKRCLTLFLLFLLSPRPVFCLNRKQWISFKINTFLKICSCCEMGWFHFWACKIQVVPLARMGHWCGFCWWFQSIFGDPDFPGHVFTIINVFVGEFQHNKHVIFGINCVVIYSYHRYRSVKHEVQRAWRVFDTMFLGTNHLGNTNHWNEKWWAVHSCCSFVHFWHPQNISKLSAKLNL